MFAEVRKGGRTLYPATLRSVWADVNARFGTDYGPAKVAKDLAGEAD